MNQFQFIQQHFAWIITVFSVLLVIYALWLNKRRSQKVLSYRVTNHPPLVAKRAGATGKIEILYDGRPVDSVGLVVIELFSLGGMEIEVKDFADPVKIQFLDKVEIFEVAVHEKHPSGLNPELVVEDSTITVKPLLMNPGDWFGIKVVMPYRNELRMRIDAWVSGVPDVTQFDPEGKRSYVSVGALITSVLLVAAAYIIRATIKNDTWYGDALMYLGLGLFMFQSLILLLLVKTPPRRKQHRHCSQSNCTAS